MGFPSALFVSVVLDGGVAGAKEPLRVLPLEVVSGATNAEGRLGFPRRPPRACERLLVPLRDRSPGLLR